jgi:hypothetical protein
MVTMRMCWCVRSRDDRVICPNSKKVYFSPWLWYYQRISCMLRLSIMLDLTRNVSCNMHWYPVRIIWQYALF